MYLQILFTLLLNDRAFPHNITLNMWVSVWSLIASSQSCLSQAKVHVCLDVARFTVAWRGSFAIHVFGRQNQLASEQNQSGCIVHSTRKYALRLCIKRQLVLLVQSGATVSSEHPRVKFSSYDQPTLSLLFMV